MANTTIVDLMAVTSTERDLSWLQESLQSAIELEFATLPIYLSGMWSIRDQSSAAYDLIRGIALEEMLHLGLACNMLTAIGGTPQIVAPSYPGPVPGGVLPDLELYLAGLNQGTLELYMQIEMPENPVLRAEETFPTIGLFYDAIREAFQTLSPPLSPDGQLTATLGVPNPDGSGTTITEPLPVLATLDEVVTAIDTIKGQGEGSENSPESPVFGGELGHYYRFGEIRYGRRFIEVDGSWQYAGDPVPFPDCYPVARVPAGGYPELPAEKDFDTQYAQLIAALQSAWCGGGQDALDSAIGTMFSLKPLAVSIMATPLPDGTGNYGPDFIAS